MNWIRWHIACALNVVVWWVMPEPQRSRLRREFGSVYNRMKERWG